MKSDKLWIESTQNMIIARVRGMPTVELLEDCQRHVTELARATGQYKILHDVLEMEAPAVEVPMAQWKIDARAPDVTFRRAIVVPDTKLAYLARLAFGESDYRVFYNDLAGAVSWLMENDTATWKGNPL